MPVPKQARAVATINKLIAAAADCLVELGYAQTSTSAICMRAGVSQGALFRHFPTKALVLAAATERMFTEMIGDFRVAVARLDAEGDRIAGAIRALWTIFGEPRLRAVFELYIAAHTDAQLRAALEPVLAAHRGNIARQARELVPDSHSNPRLDEAVDVLINAMQGAALGLLAHSDIDHDAHAERFVALAHMVLQ